MSDGTDAGGITRSAFYLYFRGRHELLTAADVGTAQALYDEADRWCTAAAVPSGAWARLGGVAAVVRTAHRPVARHHRVLGLRREIRLVWREVVGRFVDATTEHLRTEQRAGRAPAARRGSSSPKRRLKRSCGRSSAAATSTWPAASDRGPSWSTR